MTNDELLAGIENLKLQTEDLLQQIEGDEPSRERSRWLKAARETYQQAHKLAVHAVKETVGSL